MTTSTMRSMYEYKVSRVLRIVDGDTLDLEVDLGFYLKSTMRFRLLGVDTPERGQPNWAEASEFVREWTEAHETLMRIRTFKADSFGRWLADLVAVVNGIELRLSDELIGCGLAVPYAR